MVAKLTPHKQSKLDILAELRFKESTHTYTHEGFKIPGVTTILAPLSRMDQVPHDIMEAARERGSLVHYLTEHWDNNGDALDKRVHDDAEASGLITYVDAWRAFKRDLRPTFEYVEQLVFHTTRRYAGTADRIGTLGGEQTIFEVKTGEMYPEYALQTAAYAAAWDEGLDENGSPIKRRIAVLLKPSGRYSIEEFTDPNDISAFLAALTIYNWRLSL